MERENNIFYILYFARLLDSSTYSECTISEMLGAKWMESVDPTGFNIANPRFLLIHPPFFCSFFESDPSQSVCQVRRDSSEIVFTCV